MVRPPGGYERENNDGDDARMKGSVPVPDPTKRTQEQLMGAIEALKDLQDARFVAIEDKLIGVHSEVDRRYTSAEKAIILAQEAAETAVNNLRDHTEIKFSANDQIVQMLRMQSETGVRALQGILDEKFNKIDVQFKERDIRGEQTQKDGKVAIDAALLAAKEAVSEQNKSNALSNAKSEANFTKLIDQMQTMIGAVSKSLDDKLNDVKDRVSLIELRVNSMEGQKKGMSEGWGWVVGAIGIVGTVLALVLHYH